MIDELFILVLTDGAGARGDHGLRGVGTTPQCSYSLGYQVWTQIKLK